MWTTHPGDSLQTISSTLVIIQVFPPETCAQFESVANRNLLSVNTLLRRNTDLSKIVWEVIKIFELNLRWHLDYVMSDFLNNPNWSQESKIFIPRHLSRRPQISKKYQVAGLGFLCLLFSDRYHKTLWVPCLKDSIPSWMKTRRELHSRFLRLVQVRNRIAHHEIIYNYPLIEIIEFAQELLIDINEFAAEEIRIGNYTEVINKIRLGSGGGI